MLDTLLKTLSRKDPRMFQHMSLRAALTSRWFQLMIFAIAVTFFAGSIQRIGTSSSRWVQRSNAFRFTALEYRSGLPATGPGVDSFGILSDGCAVDPEKSMHRVHVANASITLVFDQVVSMNGWYLKESSRGTPDYDPVRFKVEAAAYADLDAGSNASMSTEEANNHTDHIAFAKWRLVGAPGWTHLNDLELLENARHFQNVWDLRPHWFWYVNAILGWWVISFGFTISFIFTMLRKYHVSELVLAGSFFLRTLLYLVYFFFSVVDSHIDTTMIAFVAVSAVSGFIVIFVQFANPKDMFKSLGMCAVAKLIIDALMSQIFIANRTISNFRGRQSFAAEALEGSVWVMLLIHKFVRIRRARRLVAADYARLKDEWESIAADASNREALIVLAQTVSHAQEALLARQRIEANAKSKRKQDLNEIGPGNLSLDPRLGMFNRAPTCNASLLARSETRALRQYNRVREVAHPSSSRPSKQLTAFSSIVVEVTGAGNPGELDYGSPVGSLDQV
jgi:hypothetical protein